MLFFNVSSYLVQSRVRTLVDQARFLAQTVVLEAEHGDAADVLRRAARAAPAPAARALSVHLDRHRAGARGSTCASDRAASHGRRRRRCASDRGSTSIRPATLPPWISCDGFAGLRRLRERRIRPVRGETRLVMRAVALPQVPAPRVGGRSSICRSRSAIEQRLREETGIQLGEVTALPIGDASHRAAAGRLIERARGAGRRRQRRSAKAGWRFSMYHDWDDRRDRLAPPWRMQLNLREIYDRMIGDLRAIASSASSCC